MCSNKEKRKATNYQFTIRDVSFVDATPLDLFRGGAKYSFKGLPLIWPYPVVSLIVYSSGIELGAASWWVRPAPLWRARFNEISSVQSAGSSKHNALSPILSKLVRFSTHDGSHVSFWSPRNTALICALQELGIKVQTIA